MDCHIVKGKGVEKFKADLGTQATAGENLRVRINKIVPIWAGVMSMPD